MKKNSRTFAQQSCVKSIGKAMQLAKMLPPHARIGVAVSGGVDSFVLLKCLHIRQSIIPFPFEIMALHVNPGFDAQSHAPLIPWLTEHGIASHIDVTDHGPHAHSEENTAKSACFRCAWLRRKRLFELCDQYSLTHLAFGHTADDLVHTFFMNLCQNGRVEGMSMNEPFFKGQLQVIRPMLLLEKKHVLRAARQWELPMWKNPCPSAGHTKRSQIEEKVQDLYGVYKDAQRCVYNGLIRWQLEKHM